MKTPGQVAFVGTKPYRNQGAYWAANVYLPLSAFQQILIYDDGRPLLLY